MNSLLDDDWVSLCENLWEILTGLILDTRTPLERLYKTVKYLKDKDILDFRTLQAYSIDDISEYLNSWDGVSKDDLSIGYRTVKFHTRAL